MPIYTIGHSTRSLDEFIGLLRVHGVEGIADIRTVPKSRRHPHFSAEALSGSLPQVGISYRHFPGLGGLRKPRRNSGNGAWRHEGFRGYANFMETDEFREALADLTAWGGEKRVAIMCAEAVWWRCHRQLTADVLVAHGIEVCHITGPAFARYASYGGQAEHRAPVSIVSVPPTAGPALRPLAARPRPGR
jgi:uncharacterized protein (DUF488 family)